jgi:nitrite reductase/ring-hydroxylating ferredoxin subunit/Fe-S cluster biogenesis protein NfuA
MLARLNGMSEPSVELLAEDAAPPLARLDALLEAFEQQPDEAVRTQVQELVQTLLALHHAAFHRILDILHAQPGGAELLAQIAADEYVQAVLLAQGLLPADLETRVLEALDEARTALQQHGAEVEVVGLDDGVARLRLIGSAASANVSTAELKFIIENALAAAAPELVRVEYEGVVAAPRPQRLVQITPLSAAPAPAQGKWIPLMRAQEVPDNSLRVITLGDINLLLCNVAGTIYAVPNACPHRGSPLDRALLEGAVLTCPWHGYQYDLQRGGRCLNDPAVKLAPLPLKIENGVVSVAL